MEQRRRRALGTEVVALLPHLTPAEMGELDRLLSFTTDELEQLALRAMTIEELRNLRDHVEKGHEAQALALCNRVLTERVFGSPRSVVRSQVE